MTKEMEDKLLKITNESNLLLEELVKKGSDACSKDKEYVRRSIKLNKELQEVLNSDEAKEAKNEFDKFKNDK